MSFSCPDCHELVQEVDDLPLPGAVSLSCGHVYLKELLETSRSSSEQTANIQNLIQQYDEPSSKVDYLGTWQKKTTADLLKVKAVARRRRIKLLAQKRFTDDLKRKSIIQKKRLEEALKTSEKKRKKQQAKICELKERLEEEKAEKLSFFVKINILAAQLQRIQDALK